MLREPAAPVRLTYRSEQLEVHLSSTLVYQGETGHRVVLRQRNVSSSTALLEKNDRNANDYEKRDHRRKTGRKVSYLRVTD